MDFFLKTQISEKPTYLHKMDKHLLVKLIENINSLENLSDEQLRNKIVEMENELKKRHFCKTLNLIKKRLLGLKLIFPELEKYEDIIKGINYITIFYSKDIFNIYNLDYEIYFVKLGFCYDVQYNFPELSSPLVKKFFDYMRDTSFQNKSLYEIVKDSFLYGVENLLGFEVEKVNCEKLCKKKTHIKLTSKMVLSEIYPCDSSYIYVSSNKIVPMQEHLCYSSPRKLSI